MSKGKFYRGASQRLTFEMPDSQLSAYVSNRQTIADHFGLIAAGPCVGGTAGSVDAIFQRFTRGEDSVSIEWDNWCGLMVVAESQAAEPLLREIADFLESAPAQ